MKVSRLDKKQTWRRNRSRDQDGRYYSHYHQGTGYQDNLEEGRYPSPYRGPANIDAKIQTLKLFDTVSHKILINFNKFTAYFLAAHAVVFRCHAKAGVHIFLGVSEKK